MASSLVNASVLLDDDLEQPLIRTPKETGDHEQNKSNPPSTESTISWMKSCREKMFRTSHFFYGFWLGLMIQSISLGSTAIIVIYWGAGDGESSDSIISNRKHGFFYFVLFILSRSWWLLFPAIFIAIDEGLVGGKGQGIMGKCFSRFNRSNAENVLSKPSQTEVFFGGIRFHIGIIFGCFVIWGAIDLYFGASLGVFVGLLASLLFCLSLCYGMVVIHDRFLSHDRAVAKNTTTTEAIAAVAAVIPQSPDQRKVVFV